MHIYGVMMMFIYLYVDVVCCVCRAQAVLSKPSFLSLLHGVDVSALDGAIIDRLHAFGVDTDASTTPDTVTKASMPAGVLWEWVRAIYDYHTNVINYRPKQQNYDATIINNADPVHWPAATNALTLPIAAKGSRSTMTTQLKFPPSPTVDLAGEQ
jgi:hypothetical protein